MKYLKIAIKSVMSLLLAIIGSLRAILKKKIEERYLDVFLWLN